MTHTTAQIAAGQMIIINGECRTIVSIAGRWVKLDDSTNISRAAAAAGRQEYVEDEELLGDEFTNEELAEVAAEVLATSGPAVSPATRMAAVALGKKLAVTEPADRMALVNEFNNATEESHSIVKKSYRANYEKHGNTMDNGDLVAEVMRGKPVAALVALAIQLRPEFDGRWNHLNAGQRSMNARNVIRKAFKDGTDLGVIAAHLEA